MGVMRKSGENTVAIVDEVYRRLPQIRAILPEGMSIAEPAGWVDFSKGVRGKYAKRFAEGTNLVRLEPDVAKAFPTSEAVNKALRDLARSGSDLRPKNK